MRVLVTGACGYIGSHLVYHLVNTGGHYVTALTNRDNNNTPIVKLIAHEYVVCDANDYVPNHDVVIHLGGFISVEESNKNPDKYYNGNTHVTQSLIDKGGFDNFVFASTAAAFNPISVYAKSKIISENYIRDNLNNYTIFRFFNVAGIKPNHYYVNPLTHLITILSDVVIGNRNQIVINGNDYDTRDGTCVRDYIHIDDLCRAIVKATVYPANTKYECLGSGTGYTNLEVYKTMCRVTGRNIPMRYGPRRDGDSDTLIVNEVSNYMNVTETLESMCLSTYENFYANKKSQ